MDTYGYIRVSTKEQNEDRQIIASFVFPIDFTLFLYNHL